MHDPMVVAFKIPSPIPKRSRWRDAFHQGRRWGWTRRRSTNGEPTYRWWRPAGWRFALGGRVWRWRTLVTVWHVEPGNRDAFKVCKHAGWWRWHVHHWQIQVPALQSLRARLFDRCELCGRKGRPDISHQWDGKPLGWWKFRSQQGLYHKECSGYQQLQRGRERDETLIRHLFAAVRLSRDENEAETLAWLTDSSSQGLEFNEARRLWMLLGYKRDSSYTLVKEANRG